MLLVPVILPLTSPTASPEALIYKGQVPNEDVNEKNTPMQAQPPTSVPPLSSMDQVTGYENTGFQAGWLLFLLLLLLLLLLLSILVQGYLSCRVCSQ